MAKKPFKPQPDQSTNIPLTFPVKGTDISCEFDLQPPQTTVLGTNVRAFEPTTQRARGGSRPGLSRYIDDLVGSANVIQHLNYIVDPAVEALPDYDPPDDGVTGGPNPSGGGDGTTDGTQIDPTEPARNAYGRVVRYGGSGIQLSKRRKSAVAIEYVDGASFGALFGAAPGVFPSGVAAGHLLVVMAELSFATGSGNTVTVTDTLGNTYIQAGAYVSGEDSVAHDKYILSQWYCLSASTGANTVTVTSSDAGDLVSGGLTRYRNVKPSAPVTGSATGGPVDTTLSISTGVVGVTEANQAVLVSYLFKIGGAYTFDAPGYTARQASLNAIMYDKIGVSSNQTPTATVGTAAAFQVTLMEAAAFAVKKAF